MPEWLRWIYNSLVDFLLSFEWDTLHEMCSAYQWAG